MTPLRHGVSGFIRYYLFSKPKPICFEFTFNCMFMSLLVSFVLPCKICYHAFWHSSAFVLIRLFLYVILPVLILISIQQGSLPLRPLELNTQPLRLAIVLAKTNCINQFCRCITYS